MAKSNNNSISIDKHLIKQKYNNVKELICGQKYLKAIPAIRHILAYCEYSEAQKNLYLWLALSLMKTGKPRQALE